jgi:hypothetical protein
MVIPASNKQAQMAWSLSSLSTAPGHITPAGQLVGQVRLRTVITAVRYCHFSVLDFQPCPSSYLGRGLRVLPLPLLGIWLWLLFQRLLNLSTCMAEHRMHNLSCTHVPAMLNQVGSCLRNGCQQMQQHIRPVQFSSLNGTSWTRVVK